jgi:hypothetical protein
VGIPQEFTVVFVPGTEAFTRLRNPRATFCKAGLSRLMYGLSFLVLPGLALTRTPLHRGAAKRVFAGSSQRSILADRQEASSEFDPGSRPPAMEDTQGARTVAEHERSTTLPEVLPHASPDQLPPRLAPGTTVPPLVRTEAFELGLVFLNA